MKLKFSSGKLNVSFLPVLFAIMFVPAAVIRTIQVFTLIDASTGFYKEKSILTVLLYVLVVCSCLAFCIVSFFSSNSEGIVTDEIESKKLSVAGFAFGFSMIANSVSSFVMSLAESRGNDVYIPQSKFKTLMASGSIADFIQSIFAVLAAVYIFQLASSIMKGNSDASKRKLLALAPIGWSASRLIGLFVSKISFLQVSDLFLELMMLSFMTLFFMALAQVTSGVYSDGASWRLPAYGLTSAFIAGILSISRLIASLVNKNAYINAAHPFEITDLFFFIFAVMFIFEITREYNLIFERE